MSAKLNIKETPSEELWQWLQNKVAHKFCGVPYEELSERERRSVFGHFVYMLKNKINRSE